MYYGEANGGKQIPEPLGGGDWALYKRTSTLPQAMTGTSMHTQDENGRAKAKALGYHSEPKFVFTETESGAFMDRPELDKLLRVVKDGEVELVVVLDADRLARDPLDLLNIMKVLSQAGVQLEFVHGPSPDSPEGELIMFLMGWAGKTERNLIRRRTMQAKESVARSGRMPHGLGPGLTGYDYNTMSKKVTINEPEAQVVRLIYLWAISGLTPHGIAVRLNKSGTPTKTGGRRSRRGVLLILSHTAYYGLNTYGKYRHRKVGPKKFEVTERPPEEAIEIWGFCPPIITKDLYDRVQEQLRVPQARGKKQGNRYLLTGFLRCGLCGSPVTGGMKARGRRHYRCTRTASRPERPATCAARYIREEIEEVVWNNVEEAIRNPEILSREVLRHIETGDGNLEEEARKLRKEISNIERRERRYIMLFGNENVNQEILERESASLKWLREAKEREVRVLEEQQKQKDAGARAEEQIEAFCEQMSENLAGLDFDGKRATLGAFGVKVVATKENIAITVVVDPSVTMIETLRP